MRSMLKLLLVSGCLSAMAAAWAQDDQAPGQALVVPAARAGMVPAVQSAHPPTLHNIYGRSHLLLDGRWNYIIDPYEAGYYNYRHQPFDQSATGSGGFYDDRKPKDKGESVEYSFDGSPTLAIPGDWNSQNVKLENYEGTVWMRQQFQSDPKEGKKYFLYFGAVNYEAHVYLNGRKLGSHKGGFTPFQFEVTGRLLKGQNTVIVKADNTRHQDDIPTLNTDWWNYGGITRDVLLAETPDTYIADYQIQLAKGDMGRIEGFVQMSGAQRSQDVTITIPEAGVKATVHTGADGRAAVSIPLAKNKMRYWSPEDPKLYTVTIAGVTDKLNDRIGFRTIETRGQDLLLNGKSVFLRGISLHDENPLIPGRLRGEGDMRMMLQWAKEMNCNYVRLAHYPHSEEMIRLADEMGILVWAEVPVYWTISWEKPEVYANAHQQLTDLVTRDKNRASVIIWSIGNETPVSAPRNDFMGRLADTVRSLDRTRLVGAALEVHRKGNEVTVEDPLAEKIDLASFNEYAGWYWSNNKEMLNFSFKVNYNKPVIITEFGADALGGLHADSDTRWSEEYQDQLYKNQFKMLDAIPGLRGMTPWVLTDFRSPRRPHPYYQDFWNRKGLISETGKKKQAFYTMKAYYDQKQQQYK
ncbi:glycoside hydrolase family 2 protein [Duganella hordei]|uniref:glycoside hydrolase family 2 protein n=1 Tax=Duganella hordei TaxID=2865934 RepID=UPI0030E9A0F6